MPRSSPHLTGEPTKPGRKLVWGPPEVVCGKSFPLPLLARSWGGIRRTPDDDPVRAAAVEAILVEGGHLPHVSPEPLRLHHGALMPFLSAPEALRHLAQQRIPRELRERSYNGPSLEWTITRSTFLKATLPEKMKMRTYGSDHHPRPGDALARL